MQITNDAECGGSFFVVLAKGPNWTVTVQPCFKVLFVNISRCNVVEAGKILLVEWGEIILSPARKRASWLVIA
jgi:hypothetical protein